MIKIVLEVNSTLNNEIQMNHNVIMLRARVSNK